ncbi:MAG: hypothetical protein Q8P20_06590 [bacterium]|nr:hypothetical protein [bacterium]
MSVSEIEYNLNVTIKKFEDTFAILKTEDNQEIKWPIKNLPDDIKAGKKVRLIISSEKTDKESKEKLARAVLNSILAG